MKTVCLFCASMDGIESNYKKEANKIGDVLLKHNYSLLYGGGILGLMGVAAKSANKKGVKIISVFPEYLDDPDIIFSKYQKYERQQKIKQTNLHHGADYTPYENLEIKGWPVQTWLRGKKIYGHDKFITQKNLGKYVSRDFCLL